MGQKTVRFSDLSGQLITGEEAPARIVISEHPGLASGPVEIEALVAEATDLEKAGGQAALVDLYFPGDDQPRRVVLDAAEFDKLATDQPMSAILASARPARRAPRAGRAAPATPRSGTRASSTPEPVAAGTPRSGTRASSTPEPAEPASDAA